MADKSNFGVFEMFVEPNYEDIFLGYFILLLLLHSLPLPLRNWLSECITVNPLLLLPAVEGIIF